MWVKISVEATIEIHPGLPNYQDISDAVEGYLEAVMFPDRSAVMYLNEQGKLEGLIKNEMADYLAHISQAIFEHDYIAGNVVLVGPPDVEGNDTTLPRAWFTAHILGSDHFKLAY